MIRPIPADETLALRRFHAAIRRQDARLLASALERLGEELDAGAAFHRISEWKECLEEARNQVPLSDGLLARLSSVIDRLLTNPHPPPIEGARPIKRSNEKVVALVAAWDRSLTSDQARQACIDVLDHSSSSATGQLRSWLGSGASVEALVNRANSLLAASFLGALDRPPAWMDVLVVALQSISSCLDPAREAPRASSPSLPEPLLQPLLERMSEHPGSGVITCQIGLDWEGLSVGFRRTRYDPEAINLAKLAGSLDWFYCFRCVEMTEAAGLPLAIACPRCGGPCWPLIAPSSNPYFAPAPLRDSWLQAERLIDQAPTWLVVDPPAPRSSDPVLRWLMRGWSTEKRLVVVSQERSIRDAWRSAIKRQGGRRLVVAASAENALGDANEGRQ